jgi:hypothetical protein
MAIATTTADPSASLRDDNQKTGNGDGNGNGSRDVDGSGEGDGNGNTKPKLQWHQQTKTAMVTARKGDEKGNEKGGGCLDATSAQLLLV